MFYNLNTTNKKAGLPDERGHQTFKLNTLPFTWAFIANHDCEFATSPKISPVGGYWLDPELSNSPDSSSCFTVCCKARQDFYLAAESP